MNINIVKLGRKNYLKKQCEKNNVPKEVLESGYSKDVIIKAYWKCKKLESCGLCGAKKRNNPFTCKKFVGCAIEILLNNK